MVTAPEDETEKDAGGDLADLVPDLPGGQRGLGVVEDDARMAVVPAVLLVDDGLDRADFQRREDVLPYRPAGIHDLPAPGQGVAQPGGQTGGEAARAEQDRPPAVAVGDVADPALPEQSRQLASPRGDQRAWAGGADAMHGFLLSAELGQVTYGRDAGQEEVGPSPGLDELRQ